MLALRNDPTAGVIMNARAAEPVGQRMDAIVVSTERPLDNRFLFGRPAASTVRIVVTAATPPISATGEFKLDKDHWLVTGMTLPVFLDPAQPGAFQIDWANVPSMQDRVAAADPTLVDPLRFRKEAADLVVRITAPAEVPGLPPALRDAIDAARTGNPGPDLFARSVDAANTGAAPVGQRRAVVVIVTQTESLTTEGGDESSGGSTARTSNGKHDAVLAVTVPGQPPYAVFVHGFKRARDRGDVLGAGLPALVSTSDPQAVEILWGEVPSILQQAMGRLAGATAATMGTAPAMGTAAFQQMAAAMNQAQAEAMSKPPPTNFPTTPQMPAGARDMMIQNAQLALRMTQNPAQRQLLIQQYKLAGIQLDESGNVIG